MHNIFFNVFSGKLEISVGDGCSSFPIPSQFVCIFFIMCYSFFMYLSHDKDFECGWLSVIHIVIASFMNSRYHNIPEIKQQLSERVQCLDCKKRDMLLTGCCGSCAFADDFYFIWLLIDSDLTGVSCDRPPVRKPSEHSPRPTPSVALSSTSIFLLKIPSLPISSLLGLKTPRPCFLF